MFERNGYAKISDNSISVREEEAFFIPRGVEHMIWTDQHNPLKLIYLVWGEKA